MKKLAFLFVLNIISACVVLGIGPNDVSITRMNDLLLFTDHNGSCSPTNAGMHGAYISYMVCNTTSPAVTLKNLQVTLGNFTDPQFGLAGGQQPTHFIGTLGPGECDVLYWYIYYPCVWNPAQTTNLTITVSNPPESGTKTLTETYTTWRCQSTSAGGDVVSASVTGGTTIGSIATMTVTYMYGQANAGDSYWLQPAGNITPYYASTFNAGCFQLLNSKIISSTVTGIPVGTEDRLYFIETIPHGGGQTYLVTVEYYFEVHCVTSTVAVPYAAQHSGNQDKYTGNYGVYINTFPTPTPSNLVISKTVNPQTVVPGNLVTYTVQIANTSGEKVVVDTIVDLLPSPFTFDATSNTGYVTTTNSNSYPLNGAVGTLQWIGGDMIPGDFPYTYYTVAGNSSINLVYTAMVPVGTASGTYINEAFFIIGKYESPHVQAPVYVGGDLSVTKTDGTDYYKTGNNEYTIVLYNSGPGDIVGATVTDVKPAMATAMTWEVTGVTGGASVDGSQSGSGDLTKTVNIPKDGTITIKVILTIPCGSTGTLSNTATITPPENVPDPDLDNNSVTDNDYEMIWTGQNDTNWNLNTNWNSNIVPGTMTNVIVPSGLTNYPVITGVQDVEVGGLLIEDGASVTVMGGGSLITNGLLKIANHDGLIIQSDTITSDPMNMHNGTYIDRCGIHYITSPGEPDPSAKVELAITGEGYEGCEGCWHYVTSPVYDAYINAVFWGDYAKNWFEPAGRWSGYLTHNYKIDTAQGIAVTVDSGTMGTRVFDGKLHTGKLGIDLTRWVPTYHDSASITVYEPNGGWGYNLVGNPYPSPIDLMSDSISWEAFSPAAALEEKVWYYDQSANNYFPFNAATGIGTGSRYAPSMQGFFVHLAGNAASQECTTYPATPCPGTMDGTGRFTVRNGARVVAPNIFYKDESEIPDLLQLDVTGSSGYSDATIVHFNPDASNEYDDLFDCQKRYGSSVAPQLYSVSGSGNPLSINALGYMDKNTTVPLNFFVSSMSGDYTLAASRLESFRAGTKITLEDRKLNTSRELTTQMIYNFSYMAGDDPARFLLHFFNPFFGTNDQNKQDDLVIYSQRKDIYVKDLTNHPQKGEFYLYNLLGQELAYKKLSDASLNKFTFILPTGYYIVKVITKDKTYNRKVYLD